MKCINWNILVLFALPFLLLAAVALRPEGTLRLDENHALFAQEASREIPAGMSLSQAEEFLKSNGFSVGATQSNLKQIRLPRLGKVVPLVPSPAPVKEFGFIKVHGAFPRILDKHIWRVWISVRNGRVQKAQGSYSYDRFD